MGWSSWNTYHVNISDTLIMRQADAMVAKGLKAAGYRYINIDDGFFGYRDSTGLMHAHPQRFPRGLRPVADYIHSLGFKAGIYSDAGSHTCGSRYDNDENGFWAGLYGHERQDAELYFNDWGFDFIKIDYCGAGTELNLDERRRYTEISEAFKSVGCGDVEINICRWAFPGTWARSIARSWRISPDIRPRWSSVKRIIDLNLYLSAYCGGGHYNDMDMLEIGRGMPRNEEEVHFGMWCIMSSPLMIGCDMQTIPEASLSLIKNEELIALNQDPLGLQAYVVQREGEGYVLTKDIGRRRGTERAVALYNPSGSACHFNVPLSLLELGGRVRLRDLVRRCDLEPVSDSIVCDLPARSLRLLRAEGLYRTDPVAYEAEWAYLPCFDALGKVKHQVLYAANPDASGGHGGVVAGRSQGEHSPLERRLQQPRRRLRHDHHLCARRPPQARGHGQWHNHAPLRPRLRGAFGHGDHTRYAAQGVQHRRDGLSLRLDCRHRPLRASPCRQWRALTAAPHAGMTEGRRA